MGTEFSNIDTWSFINTFYARIFGIYNICVNRVGEEAWEVKKSFAAVQAAALSPEEIVDTPIQDQSFRFWGGSEIINPYGQQISKAALYEEDAISGEISRDLLRKKKILLPYLRNDDPYFTHRELQRILYGKT